MITRIPALLIASFLIASFSKAEFKAGAVVVDVTPPKLPVLVNGGMLSRYVEKINTRVNARALALSDDKETAVIVVVDSCMMGRALLDEAKAEAASKTGIPADKMLISATHAHSAPSSMGCLGTDADPTYVPFLKAKLVEAISEAKAALKPARIGFGKIDAAEYTALRQWIRRPDRLAEDPFGNLSVRANMHAGRVWDDVTGEAGPEDPDLAMISIQTVDGKPLAALGNFSMHYFGDKDISADYFGLFCEGVKQRLAKDANFVALMSHGCSGDIYRRDYTITEEQWKAGTGGLTIQQYADALADLAVKSISDVHYETDVPVVMAEQRLHMKYRTPNKQTLEWAQRVMAEAGDRPQRTPTEVYAKEQILLHELQETDVVVQALRLGDIGIATTPCETYAVTGLKVKAASPLKHNIVIELANGGDGYIPPPEQHPFGGYNTWPARSAGLEVSAEPRIAQAAISLLEKVSGKERKPWLLSEGKAAAVIKQLKPAAYWRLNEFNGPTATDSSDNERHASYEPGITFYLEGPKSADFCQASEKNRAAHFVGGRLVSELTSGDYTVSAWIWNGMPNEGRDVAGWFVSADHGHGLSKVGEHLGIGGKSGNTGRLIFLQGNDKTKVVAGETEIPRWQWQHVALVRMKNSIKVYLNGKLEIASTLTLSRNNSVPLFIGGRSDNSANWEGRLDEVAIFPRALTTEELSKLTTSSTH
ncbi:MAG: hypothetical protein JNJ83_11495 [Verrucomicrobiaceae bacterium]|nr:hypothetical protein [Verrucomicrobiaceae bacterium]